MFEARAITVTTPLGTTLVDDPDGFRFARLTGYDGLGECFRYELTLVTINPNIDHDDLLGLPVTIQIESALGDRFFHGVVDAFRFSGVHDGFAHYVLTLRPHLWFLSKTTDNRIFQDMAVPDIVSAVLRDHQVEEFEFQLTQSYQPRSYCVQYGETDLDFVQRLLEHEGIWYYFTFEDGQHTLIFTDANSRLPSYPGYEEIAFDRDALHAGASAEGVISWESTNSVVSGSYTHTDFDFMRPSADLMQRSDEQISDNLADKARYHYPGNYIDHGIGSDLARTRRNEFQAPSSRCRAHSAARGPSSGYVFTFGRHTREIDNTDYFIIRAEYDIWDGQYLAGRHEDEAQEGFVTHWQVQPLALPYHPPRRTPRPVMKGPQTAIVVGPGGEEIHTDEYSRVKVHFHWDRLGQPNDNETCWIRVSATWAGSGWGFIQIPRIGQEVIVDFLEGDPDQPLVTGRVYNAENMPPYGLPGSATQSGWKSNSSPGGGGFNELRFEDKKGSEEVYFQAEKDHNELVKNNESRNIGNDFYENVGHDARQEIVNDRSEWVGNNKDTTVDLNRTVVIGVDDTESVGSNRSLTVGADETITVGANSTETIGSNLTQNVGSNHSQTVGSNQTITVGLNRTDTVAVAEVISVGGLQQVNVGAARSVDVGATLSHSVGASDSWSVGAGRSVSIGADLSESVGKNASHTVGDDMTIKVGKKLAIDAGEEVQIVTGKASILMKKDGTIQIKGKDLKIDASGKIDVKASSSIKMKGSKIDLN